MHLVMSEMSSGPSCTGRTRTNSASRTDAQERPQCQPGAIPHQNPLQRATQERATSRAGAPKTRRGHQSAQEGAATPPGGQTRGREVEGAILHEVTQPAKDKKSTRYRRAYAQQQNYDNSLLWHLTTSTNLGLILHCLRCCFDCLCVTKVSSRGEWRHSKSGCNGLQIFIQLIHKWGASGDL